MFLLDSLMISGIGWALRTVVTAAEAEMNDDTALREQLLAAEMRRETGEMSDEEYAGIEADLLARIREIKERREGPGALSSGGAGPMEATPGSTFHVEASVSGDFYDPAEAPHTAVVETTAAGGRNVRLLDMEPGDPAPPDTQGLPLPSGRAPRRNRTPRRTRTPRTPRTPRTRSR